MDSFGCSAQWQPLGSGPVRPLNCRSVGWLVHDGDDCKVIVPHISRDHEHVADQGCGDMTIPAAAILRIAELIEP